MVQRTSNIVGAWLLLTVWLTGCSPYELRHENQWNAREQIWLSESSQLKVRSAQSRVYDTTDRRRLLEAIVSTLQDLDFKVEVLDEDLGIVSGKKFVDIEEPFGIDPTYPAVSPRYHPPPHQELSDVGAVLAPEQPRAFHRDHPPARRDATHGASQRTVLSASGGGSCAVPEILQDSGTGALCARPNSRVK